MPGVASVSPAWREPVMVIVDSGLMVTECLLTSAPASLTE